MNAKDVKCPICGTVNRSLDLDETDGWMECEHCHNAVQILEYAKSRRVPVYQMADCNLQYLNGVMAVFTFHPSVGLI